MWLGMRATASVFRENQGPHAKQPDLIEHCLPQWHNNAGRRIRAVPTCLTANQSRSQMAAVKARKTSPVSLNCYLVSSWDELGTIESLQLQRETSCEGDAPK